MSRRWMCWDGQNLISLIRAAASRSAQTDLGLLLMTSNHSSSSSSVFSFFISFGLYQCLLLDAEKIKQQTFQELKKLLKMSITLLQLSIFLQKNGGFFFCFIKLMLSLFSLPSFTHLFSDRTKHRVRVNLLKQKLTCHYIQWSKTVVAPLHISSILP